ncbi:uncharacterized protein LOC124121044 [Haliotis rufescens]|uniref:uncharacterized protein LOC124121044 n=1 Tax=Haliotis rufescens TaxID=6454 RepID=UPI001EB040FD|nr:uncharacterized protein LOC124121044 [Haliotis rufescens]
MVVVVAAMEAEATEAEAMEVAATVVVVVVVTEAAVTVVEVTEVVAMEEEEEEDTEVVAMEEEEEATEVVATEEVVTEEVVMEVVVMEADTTVKRFKDHHIHIKCWTFDIIFVDCTHHAASIHSVYFSTSTNKAVIYIVNISLVIFSSSTIKFKIV